MSFLFFKQRTAYEMRISDWSSDVCSSDLERENLIDFGQAHFPRRAGIFDAGLGRGAGAASVARDEDDVGVRLGDPGSHRADARRADQLHADARLRIDLLQVVDELRQILDRIDVVVGRRADQRDAGRRVAQPRDELGDLEARKLAALAGLGALCDLDLDLVARAAIFGGYAETAARDLLDVAVGVVAIGK